MAGLRFRHGEFESGQAAFGQQNGRKVTNDNDEDGHYGRASGAALATCSSSGSRTKEL